MEYLQFLLNYGGALIAGCIALWTARQSRKATKELSEQQNKYTAQIEALKTQLAFSLERQSKFANAEYETLTELWGRLSKFYNEVMRFRHDGFEYLKAFKEMEYSQMQTDIARLPESAFMAFMKKESYPLSERQIDFIMQVDPQQRIVFLSNEVTNFFINKCRKALSEFTEYYKSHSIYIADEDLQKDFIKSRDAGKQGIVHLRNIALGLCKNDEEDETRSKANAFLEDFDKHIDALEKVVHMKIAPKDMELAKERQHEGA